MLYFIEGARNVGKTFLINKVKNNLSIELYKYPFKDIYDEYTDETHINSDSELFYITLGYDITILDLIKYNQIKHDIIVDRGVLSDIIFGIQSGRINKETGIKWWNYLYQYKDYFKVIYIYSDNDKDNRNKDIWNFYKINETHNLYLDFMKDVNYDPIFFKNEYNNKSIEDFISLFK